MTKLDLELGEEADYHGSKVFLSLADALGLSVDLVCAESFMKISFSIIFACHSHPLEIIFDDNLFYTPNIHSRYALCHFTRVHKILPTSYKQKSLVWGSFFKVFVQ